MCLGRFRRMARISDSRTGPTRRSGSGLQFGASTRTGGWVWAEQATEWSVGYRPVDHKRRRDTEVANVVGW